MHTTISFARNIGEGRRTSQCNCSKGTNCNVRRVSQLGSEGLRSLITSKISLIAYSITHFLSSSIPHFFTSVLCLLQEKKNCTERVPTPQIHPSDCIFSRKQGQSRGNKRERDARRSDKASEGGGEGGCRTTQSHSSAAWMRP